jgi:methylglyoxal synthase
MASRSVFPVLAVACLIGGSARAIDISAFAARGCGLQFAVVAHDGKKDALKDFVVQHMHFFRGKNLVATGQTGKQLVERLAQQIENEESNPGGTASDPRQRVHDALGIDVDGVAHGPHGGDAVIGKRILQGKIGGVFFYINPELAQPHVADIRAFIRIADLQDVPLALNPATAHWVIEGADGETPAPEPADPRLIAITSSPANRDKMVAFVKEHLSYFKAQKLIATADDAALLKPLGLDVQSIQSAQEGGQVYIAGEISEPDEATHRDSRVKSVFFFRDPRSTDAHEADVDALVRVTIFHDVPLATNFGTAEAMVRGFEKAQPAATGAPAASH